MTLKRPLSILVAIWTPAGETLILHRQSPARFWQSVTGSLETDETPRQAAVREVAEEAGLTVAPEALSDLRLTNRYPIPEKWAARYPPDQRHNTEHVFSLRLEEAVDVRIDPTEHSEAQWSPIDEAIDTVWSWTNKDLLTLIRASLGD